MQAVVSPSPFPLWLLFLQVFYKTHRLASRVLLIVTRKRQFIGGKFVEVGQNKK